MKAGNHTSEFLIELYVKKLPCVVSVSLSSHSVNVEHNDHVRNCISEFTVFVRSFSITFKTYYRLAVNSYPETRHRYWNGYMLFYESTDKLKYDSSNDSRGNLVRQDAVMEGQR